MPKGGAKGKSRGKRNNVLKSKLNEKLGEEAGSGNVLKSKLNEKLGEEAGSGNVLKSGLKNVSESRTPINRDPVGIDDERVLYASTTRIWDGLSWEQREQAVLDYFKVKTIEEAIEVARYDPFIAAQMNALRESPASDTLDSPPMTKAVKGYFTSKRSSK